MRELRKRRLLAGWAAVFFMFAAAGPAFSGEILTWHDCVREAQKNHPDLISAEENLSAVKSRRDITSSRRLPQAAADISAGTAQTRSAGSSADFESYSYGVNVSQLIYDGSQTAYELRSARENIDAGREAFRFASAEVRFRLRRAFIVGIVFGIWPARQAARLDPIEALRYE